MQFIDLKRQYIRIKDDIDSGIAAVMEHGAYIMGPEIPRLEKALAEYAGVRHCTACSSGTDALLMPLMALGIGAGDAVFTTPFTFIATAEVISLLGATPVFCDIDPKTYNIDPDCLIEKIKQVRMENKLNAKAMIPVDLFGQPADYPALEQIASDYGLILLEDAAQGFGGSIGGKRAGSFGNVGATSFFPAKPLGCYGDGGAIFTNDDKLHELLTSIRNHGQGAERYDNVRIGINGRLDSIQAAALLVKLQIFDDEIESRNRVAAMYSENLQGKLVTPCVKDGYLSSWAQYSVIADSSEHRSSIIGRLKEQNVPTAVYYPKPLHLQDAFAGLGGKFGDFPATERAAARIFSLPMHPYLSDEEINAICKII